MNIKRKQKSRSTGKDSRKRRMTPLPSESLPNGLNGDSTNAPPADPQESESALRKLGAAALAAQQFAAAAEYYERLIELDPRNYDDWLNLGIARHRSGNHAGAVESYRTALEIRPDGSSALMNLGTGLTRGGLGGGSGGGPELDSSVHVAQAGQVR